MKLENNRISTRHYDDLWSFESLCHSLKAWSELEKGHSGVTKFLPETVNVTWARADSRSTPWNDHQPMVTHDFHEQKPYPGTHTL